MPINLFFVKSDDYFVANVVAFTRCKLGEKYFILYVILLLQKILCLYYNISVEGWAFCPTTNKTKGCIATHAIIQKN